MTRYITLPEALYLHKQILKRTGGAAGIRDFGALQSSLGQPGVAFEGKDLYPGLVDKAAALGFFLISNHSFVDGNKRIGHAAMELMLLVNGYEIEADLNEQERTIVEVAAGLQNLRQFTAWLSGHIQRKGESKL